MQLITWLEIQQMSIQEFAKKIGKHPSLVHKYLYEDVIPKISAMQAIYLVTCGAVTANDFYKLSEIIFQQELVKRKMLYEPEIDFSK